MLGILKPCSGPMKSSLGLGSDPGFPTSAAYFRIRSQFTCSFVSNLFLGNARFVLASRMLLYAFLFRHFSHCSGLLLLSTKALQQEAALSQESQSIFQPVWLCSPWHSLSKCPGTQILLYFYMMLWGALGLESNYSGSRLNSAAPFLHDLWRHI